MNCVELFAGAGGAALGLERAGFRHSALVEWDSDACATMRAAGLSPVVHGDVRDLDAIRSVAPDRPGLLWSSFPCQAFSQAGSRQGASDERNGWPWTVDAIDALRPVWFAGENVRGLLQHSGEHCGNPLLCPGCYFHGTILPELRARFGHVGWWLLDAADYGVPQHRRRVIIWAGPAPLSRPVPTHGTNLRPEVTVRAAIGAARCMSCDGSGASWSPLFLTRPCGACCGSGQCRIIGNEDVSIVATGRAGGGVPRSIDRAAPTIGTKGTAMLLRSPPGEKARPDTPGRRLSWREEARLMGLPEWWSPYGGDGSKRRQAGNAVPPPLAEAVGRVVIAADALVKRDAD